MTTPRVPAAAGATAGPVAGATAGPGAAAATHGMVTTADGERLDVLHLVRSSPSPDPLDLAAVVAHGFTGSFTRPAVRAVADALARHAGVVAVDQRGHGGSSGLTTMGDREVLDVDAAVAHARALGYRRVVTVGWSMGGSSVLRHAALVGATVHGHPVTERVDAVVSVSATSRWFVRDTAPMRRVHRLVETRTGRVAARRLLGVRIDPAGWVVTPASPLELVAAIAPTPLLVVHGDRDHYFTLEHPRALAAAAGEPVELWEVPGFGHAEEGVTPELLDRLGAHLATLADRAVPA